MEVFLFIACGVLMVLGLIGCFAPVLPGPPLCYAALLCAHFTERLQFTPTFLIVWGLVVVLVIVLEYIIPIKATKRFGGSKAGEWGAMIGLLVGLFIVPPIGALGGTIIGAFIGELLINNTEVEKAAKAAMGALIGFVLSTGLKLVVSVAMLVMLIIKLIDAKGWPA